MSDKCREFLAIFTEPKDSKLTRVMTSFFHEIPISLKVQKYMTGLIFLTQNGVNFEELSTMSNEEIGLFVSERVDAKSSLLIQQLETMVPLFKESPLLQRSLIFFQTIKQSVIGSVVFVECTRVFDSLLNFITVFMDALREIWFKNTDMLNQVKIVEELQDLISGDYFGIFVPFLQSLESLLSFLGMGSLGDLRALSPILNKIIPDCVD